MASRRRTFSLAYPRRAGSTRSTTRVDYHSLVLVLGLLSLAAFAGVLYLSQASVAAQLHFRLEGAEWEAQDLRVRNVLRRQEIADSERLATIEERAAHLGMVSAAPSRTYLTCVVPQVQPAARPRSATVAQAQEDQQAGSSLWSRLAHRLGLARSPRAEQLVVLNAGHP